MSAVNILDVKVDCVSKQKILEVASRWAGEDRLRTIAYVNAHCLNVACSDDGYRKLLNRADLVYPDGIGVVWAGRLLNGCTPEKVTGRDWIFDLCALAGAQGMRFYILAGLPGIADKAKRNLLAKWPELKITGASDGFFIEKSETQVLDELADQAPHVLLVGMGVPQQERWIAAHRDEIPVPVCWSVGALFDYVAGVEPAVPGWMDALALEWLWRLLLNPPARWRRYLLGNPLFIARVLHQKFLGRAAVCHAGSPR